MPSAVAAFGAAAAVSVSVGNRNYAMSDRDSLYIGFYIDGLSAGDLR